MENRRIISIVIFVLAVVLFLLIGLGWGGGTDLAGWLIGALVGAAFIVAGLFFWRRGK
jgi:hypothetical protein